MAGAKKTCLRCRRDIEQGDLHKIVIYVIQDRLAEHHYEHVECPGRFTVSPARAPGAPAPAYP